MRLWLRPDRAAKVGPAFHSTYLLRCDFTNGVNRHPAPPFKSPPNSTDAKAGEFQIADLDAKCFGGIRLQSEAANSVGDALRGRIYNDRRK